MQLHVLENVGLNQTIINAISLSNRLRLKGQAQEIDVLDGKKHLLTITPMGAVEEVMVPPLRVRVGDRLAHDVTNGGVTLRTLNPRQKNAISFARLIVGQHEEKKGKKK